MRIITVSKVVSKGSIKMYVAGHQNAVLKKRKLRRDFSECVGYRYYKNT
jgi:hypothetical protein